MLLHIGIGHLEHLVDIRVDLLHIDLGVANQDIGRPQANEVELLQVLVLGLVQARDGLQDLREAIVHQLVGFFLELFVSDENLVVRVDVGDSVGEFLLGLGSQIADNA